jgi:phosphosulfolactate synthase
MEFLNYEIPQLPYREPKPNRQKGISMVMDKGLSLREVENLLEVGKNYIDLVKLGWATSFVTPHLKEKIELYHSAGIPVYFGGTLLEIFLVRNAEYHFEKLLEKYHISHVEISSGSLDLSDEQKLDLIAKYSKNYIVLSEVGSKDPLKEMAPYKWVESIKNELQAGSWKVITEAREGGNVGVYRSGGEVRDGLVDEILHSISYENLIFEAPKKEQQVFFIKLLGANVNLGNIATADVIGLETLRLGLRSDTFYTFL